MGKSTAHATIESHGSFKGESTSSAWQIMGTNGGLDVIYRGCIDTGHLGRHRCSARVIRFCHAATT